MEKIKLFNTNFKNCIDVDSNQDSKSYNEQTNKKLTIKDLCHEDKIRIANLIKELAK